MKPKLTMKGLNARVDDLRHDLSHFKQGDFYDHVGRLGRSESRAELQENQIHELIAENFRLLAGLLFVGLLGIVAFAMSVVTLMKVYS